MTFFKILAPLTALLTPMNITLIILLVTTIFFMRGKVRSDLVALSALLALVISNVLTPAEALQGFSNSVVIMMIGLFVVGGAIFRTGLAKMISSRILRLAGHNENLLFILVMLVTAFIGAFVSNTGTVAVMLPIIMSMTTEAKISPRRYLMPLAFASSMGLFTLISTPPNLVIQEALTNSGFEPLSFFSFAPVGAICLSVGVFILFFLSKRLVNKNESAEKKTNKGKTLAELAEEYNLKNQSYKVAVNQESPLIGKTLAELQIATKYHISIIKIERVEKVGRRFKSTVVEEFAGPKTMILLGDILYCHGVKENVNKFIAENHLFLKDKDAKHVAAGFQKSGIAEVFIMPNSTLINKSISELKFRDEFHVSVLGIQRHNEYNMNNIQHVKLHSGDALLVHGSWKNLANLSERQSDLVLVGQPLKEAAKVTLDKKAPVAAVIMLCMILTMAFNLIPAVIAVMIAAVLMVVTGCLRNMEEAYGTINWESIVLIAAMLPMSTAFEKTGAASLISDGLVGGLGEFGPYALLAGVYFCTSILTLFISNTATAVLFAPIALQAALSLGLSPYPFLFAVAVGASMCFASPFSTPPNALVMSAGRYSFMDFIKVGLPLQLIMGVVMVLLLPLIFPF